MKHSPMHPMNPKPSRAEVAAFQLTLWGVVLAGVLAVAVVGLVLWAVL